MRPLAECAANPNAGLKLAPKPVWVKPEPLIDPALCGNLALDSKEFALICLEAMARDKAKEVAVLKRAKHAQKSIAASEAALEKLRPASMQKVKKATPKSAPKVKQRRWWPFN